MVGKVLELVGDIIQPDQKASQLARQWLVWENMRNPWKKGQEEINRYLYATDTSSTSNSILPWKNKTTIPKISQISDNLYSNYTLTIAPKDKYVFWKADNADDNSVRKRNCIQNYMSWVMRQPMFKQELFRTILDYIHKGNAIAMPDWVDQRVEQKDKTQIGYIGPVFRRLSPLDVVCNPTADNWTSSPKFVRTIMSMGELKDYLGKISNEENRVAYENLYEYLKEIRMRARGLYGDWVERDALYQMEGFGTFQQYLLTNSVEVITFYGDFYNADEDLFEKNRVITIVDRHKIMDDKANPSFFGYPPIYHCPWRKRVDNLWGMGVLENLIGMQYRLDHMENMKADMMDLSTYPVQKVKGFVEDFTWQPGEKIFTSEEGDVELVQPNINVQQLVEDIQMLMNLMEEMAGAPKEAMGFRSPGEKTKYEVQRLESAASRIFQNKINQFEEFILEPMLNGMLELARRNMTSAITIPVTDSEFDVETFQELSVEDITGSGRIVVRGARHFAEQAEMVQNLQGLFNSPGWQFVQQHFSSVKMAQMYEDTFDLKDYGIVMPYVNISEQADAQRKVQALQEQLHQEMGTATGMGQDHDLPLPPPARPQQQGPLGLSRGMPPNAVPQGTIATQ
jgi:hypothetical protein